MNFEALFPPLIQTPTEGAQDNFDSVDISVNDILLPPLEKSVDDGIYQALRRWNEGDPAVTDKALLSSERIKKYRRIAALALQSDSALNFEKDEHANEEKESENDLIEEVDRATAVAKQKAATAALRQKKKQQKKRKKEIEEERVRLESVLVELKDIDSLRAERVPSERIQSFVNTFKIKKRRLAQKRSMADTITAMSFDSARPVPNIEQQERMEGGETKEKKIFDDLMDKDPILWFDVLHPSKDPARTQSFLVRLSQKISDLVDLVVCANDERLIEHAKVSKFVYFSKKMFIDRRVSDSLDYSEQIIRWIQAKPERQSKYGTFDKKAPQNLHTSTFADLELYIDVPGVYIHQGECEHLLRLRDARLPHELDAPMSSNLYPLRLPNPLSHTLRNCLICQNYSAKFVCYGDRLATVDPMFYCNRCYQAAHYDANGKLLYDDFLSFPFVQD
ncbi:Small nuclear RNA activating protein complex-50kD subunit (SNAP50) [Plasmopara halstedii]|uniref:Small nuclear RNA activating protein complex-50kD subunit (SNAP50) n=1 Tax=Plasmopara halstedii TaxID=4781 RepID=A0A0P1AQD6_PLAHL|nr:Small nuclear RNA activating protein complex-50kD subunit (SNAP50) [Plasmopara halstedii]CEG43434.1 Small nuclear RNA activating protein complex-50kD subunit (SNAP50) [Plasmopara halstedii]|eukprot:XP_024579803.1 Small nuclear RNA activating protein complex-50kD subunit (SNAP50) [Plasmopara halstedii]